MKSHNFQVLLDRRVSAVCQQMFTLGYVEHELTRLNNGMIGMKQGTDRKVGEGEVSWGLYI